MIALAAGVWLLREARVVLIPMVAALLMSAAAAPLARRLSNRIPRPLAIALTMTLVAASLGAFVGLIGWLSYTLATDIHDIWPQVRDTAAPVTGLLESWGMMPSADSALSRAKSFAVDGIGILGSGLSGVVLILFLTALAIAETAQLRTKADIALPAERSDRLQHLVGALSKPVRRYLLAKTGICLVSGAFTGLAAWVAGLDNPLLFACLTFALSYVPNVGALLAFVPPVLFALVTGGPMVALALGAALVAMETLMAYVVEPRVMGRSLQLSSVVVLASLIVWGWLWGLVGVFLAVPLTIAAKIACLHFDSTRAVGVFLSGDPEADESIDAQPASG